MMYPKAWYRSKETDVAEERCKVLGATEIAIGIVKNRRFWEMNAVYPSQGNAAPASAARPARFMHCLFR